jgi:prepilin signal peptidase PulO-like enzyme (type II secretory pathway)
MPDMIPSMPFLIPGILFVVGAIVASFIGVVTGRLYTEQGFLTNRSRCDACGTPLSPGALVPIVSYFLLRRRAYCCSARLSLWSPVTEALLGGLFAGAYLGIGLVPSLPFFLIALSALLALVLYDFNHQIIPTPFLAVFVVASAVAGFLLSSDLSAFLSSLTNAFLIGASLALLHFLSGGRAMGLADAPLAFGLALLVGPVAFSGFIFSFWIGAVVGIVLLLRRPAGSRMGVEVPFAPFLAAGFLLAYFTQWNLFSLITLYITL